MKIFPHFFGYQGNFLYSFDNKGFIYGRHWFSPFQCCDFLFQGESRYQVHYITLENYLPDLSSVIFHFNSFDPEGGFWQVSTMVIPKHYMRAFSQTMNIPIGDFDNQFFNEDEINEILWNNPIFINRENRVDEEAIREVEKQKGTYRECIEKGEANPEDVQRRLNEALSGVAKTPFVRTYAVGQANFSALFEDLDSRSPIGVFDLGINENKKVLAPMIASSFSSNGFVLLSHFDSDHINGCQLLPPNSPIFQRIWISHVSSKIAKQGTALQIFSCVPRNNWFFLPAGSVLPCNHLEIDVAEATDPKTGKKLDPYQSSVENGTCVMAFIKYSRSILLPGDALYGNFLHQFSPDYCLIPHHSCEYPVSIPPAKMDCSKVSAAFIPVSFTGQAGYHHPSITHFSQYKEVHRFTGFYKPSSPRGAVYYDKNEASQVDAVTKKESGISYDFYL